jgi:hypothetical protein
VALGAAALAATCLAGTGSPASGSGAAIRLAGAAAAGDRAVVHSEAIPSTGAVNRRSSSDVVARIAPTGTPSYGMVAVTWDHGSAPNDITIKVRTRADGTWTPWQALEVELDEGPSESEEGDVRDGTSPAWAGDADGVAVRATSASGRAPSGLRVVTISAGDGGPVAAATATDSSRSGFVAPTGKRIKHPPAFPGMPTIVTRKQWGANPRLGDACWEPLYGVSAKMVFIHHTVNSNDYSPSDGAAIVRSIQAYHTQSRGWCDIGYNFLVDRYGTIYEGRRGGTRLPVRGAHAGDYNTNTVGISMIGNFDTAGIPAEMKNAIVRLVGWRLGTSYAPAKGMLRVNGTRFHRISGHRDAMSTTCPGRYGYAWLPNLRDRVHEYLSRFSSTIEAKRDLLGGSVTGPVFVGELKVSGGAMFAKAGAGTHWLTGRPLRAYRAMHGSYGRLGFPRTDARETAVEGVSRVTFEHGRMFVVPHRSPRTLWGRVMLRYGKLGGLTGAMGLPTSSVTVTDAGAYATFEHGSIRWNRATGDVTVIRS